MKKAFLFVILTVFLLAGCRGQNPGNAPYEPDGPAPAAHDGVFRSEHGTLSFNGDGQNVVIDFDAYLAGLSGLPEGELEGTYVFLSGELPPNGSVKIRYDAAHEVRISCGESEAVITLGIAAEDGKSASVGVGIVTPERIPMLFNVDGKSLTVLFTKETAPA